LGLHRNKKTAPLVEGGASVTIKPTSLTASLLYHDLGRSPKAPTVSLSYRYFRARNARAAPTEMPRVSRANSLAAGLRRGELQGLKWDNPYLEAGTLQVRRTLSEPKGGWIFEGSQVR
jgi:integrase